MVGAVIIYPQKYNDIAKYIIADEVWYDSRCKILWKIITAMIRKREHVDMITVTSSLSEGDRINGVDSVFVVDCTNNCGSSGTMEVYASKMYEKYLLRLVIEITSELNENAMNNKVDVLDTLVTAHTSIGELISLRPDSVFDIDESLSQAIESIRNTEKLLIKTNFANIDGFAGGLTRGEITIIGGRPGHGKSTMLLNVLSNMLSSDRKVLLFNRELTNVEVLKKLIAIESKKLSYTMIRKGIYDVTQLQELDRVRDYIAKKYNPDKFRMYDQIRDFAGSATEVKKFKPDVILDDYIQLITPINSDDPRRLQLERLVNDYKWIAKEYGCVVILASQLNRGIETRGNPRPQLSDLAESGAIEQVAENVFFVYYSYKVDQKPENKNIITLVAAKVRYGETGDVQMAYDGDRCKIYNNEEDFYNRDKVKIQENETLFKAQ